MPIVMPMAAENQMLAAVVRFVMLPVLSFRIIPAPRKPMPVTIAARRGTERSSPISAAATASAEAPTATRIKVPKPTGFWLFFPSKP